MVIKGEESLVLLKEHLLSLPYKHYLIVTDQGMTKVGLVKHLMSTLQDSHYHLHVYDQTVPNPTVQNIDDAYQLYQTYRCDAIIGFGGGSSLDCAKGLSIKVAYPKKKIAHFKGILKIHRKLVPVIAIPTTAGTGSECTLAAVISDPQKNQKYAIMDMHLVPTIAVLDPTLLKNLPSFYTATTGMDALTHAMEAWISLGRTKKTDQRSLNAMSVIFNELERSYLEPDNLSYRMHLLEASYDAGYAFTRAYVGNIHAIAHAFGGFYHIPHGYANAIIMPHVLHYSLPYIEGRLAKLYDHLYPNDHLKRKIDKAHAMIEKIKSMNLAMNIPEQIVVPHDQYVEDMVAHAHKEANPLYPVPHIYRKQDFKLLFHQILNTKL
jgi:alcohol dehydrogenase class IV